MQLGKLAWETGLWVGDMCIWPLCITLTQTTATNTWCVQEKESMAFYLQSLRHNAKINARGLLQNFWAILSCIYIHREREKEGDKEGLAQGTVIDHIWNL